MALEAKLLQKLSQSLLMTPQLQQAIKLLQLGRLEYKEAIERELLENPVLEEAREAEDGGAGSLPPLQPEATEMPAPRVEGEDSSSSNSEVSGSSDHSESASESTKSPVDWEDYIESFTDWRGAATPRGTFDDDDRPMPEAASNQCVTLEEHLLDQLRFIEIPEHLRTTLFHIVGNLTRDGYLCVSHEELAAEAGCSTAEVLEAIAVFRTLDPAGIAARDLKECLLFQLENQGLENSLEARIVRSHLERLEKRKYDQIAKEEGVPIEVVHRAIETIRSLEPCPGRQFADETARYVVPDVYVQKIAGEYIVTLNEDGLPKLRISPYYLSLLREKDSEGVPPNKAYLVERLKAASWLIKSIHQRQATIYKVAESIVKFQKEFFEHGVQKLKPLVLKDVADDIGMHESTVSRVTTSKYMHTPQGVYELKFFFTTGLRSEDGSEVSSSAIKDRIRRIIAEESPSLPVSDQQIVELLKKDNIDVARRTVAKYRESLGIESSSRRKRPF